jgi:Fe-S-cluster-containing dehydrogenase component
MSVDRRNFFKILSAGAVTAAGIGSAKASDDDRFKRSPEAVGLLYDATICVGCKACEVGCKKANDLPAEHSSLEEHHGVSEIWDSKEDTGTESFLKIKVARNGDGKTKDQAEDGYSFFRTACMHCVDPDCQSVCPTSALLKDPKTGIVTWNIDACCGCRYCQMACPFTIPRFEYNEPFPKLSKCYLCSHRVEKGEISGCAEYCPTGATLYGKVDDLIAEAKKRVEMEPGSEYEYPVHTLDSGVKTRKHTAKYIEYVYGEKDGGGTQYVVLSAVPFKQLGLPSLPDHSSASKSEGLQHTIYKGMIGPVVLLGGLAFAAYRTTKNETETE